MGLATAHAAHKHTLPRQMAKLFTTAEKTSSSLQGVAMMTQCFATASNQAFPRVDCYTAYTAFVDTQVKYSTAAVTSH